MGLFDEVLPVKAGKKLPWERQNREPEDYYDAFEHFLASKSRSLEEVADKFSMQLSFVQDISKKYNWYARSNAYDHQSIVKVEAQIISSKESAVMDMTDNHVTLARKAQQVAATGLKILEDYISEYEFAKQAGADLPPRPYLKPDEIVKLGRFGTELERLSLGEATSRNETKTTDYSQLSDQELKLLQELLSKTETDDDN